MAPLTPECRRALRQHIEPSMLNADEVGLGVVAFGQHHNPPFVASAPTTTMAYVAAQTKNIILWTATTLITTTAPVRVAEDYATLQHLTDGRMDLMLGRGNTARSTRGSARTSATASISLPKTTRCSIASGAKTSSTGDGSARRSRASRRRRGHLTVRPFVSHGRIRTRRSPSRPPTTATASSPITSSGPRPHATDGPVLPRALRILRPRPGRGGNRRPWWAAVHAPQQPGCDPRVPTVLRSRRSTAAAPASRHTWATPLTVGPPEQVIERTLGFRDYVGDYQRQASGELADVVLGSTRRTGGESDLVPFDELLSRVSAR